jgi:pimeloyl-ACP methyl ester carboxylesterase
MEGLETMSTQRISVAGLGTVEVSFSDQGTGHPVLLLHGGGGPQTVGGFAELLATQRPARVITPTHPGFGGTSRPDWLASVPALAALYLELVADLGLRDVTVVGNSIGGWIAAEMAIASSERISSFVLVDAVGIVVPGHPIADFFSLTPRQVAELSYHDPDKFGIDPSKLSPEALQMMTGNRATLRVYAGTSMGDPGLSRRLAAVSTPTLVVWGDSDQIADAGYGRALADAIPGAQFLPLTDSGHLPQIETPRALLEVVWAFAETHEVTHPAS